VTRKKVFIDASIINTISCRLGDKAIECRLDTSTIPLAGGGTILMDGGDDGGNAYGAAKLRISELPDISLER
jgi:hypothetical protein